LARHHIRLYQSRLAATKAAAHIPFQPLSDYAASLSLSASRFFSKAIGLRYPSVE
jgi:hypothetical protein